MTKACPGLAREQGMALLEVLIACAIVAAMLGVTFEAIQTTARATARLDRERKAVLVAQSVMARVGADIVLAPGTTSGSDTDMQWQISVELYRGDGARPNDNPALMHVKVSVNSPTDAKARFTLNSLMLAS